MAARLAHASATPAVLDLGLWDISPDEKIYKAQHKTAGGAVLQYIIGTRCRRAKVVLLVLGVTERDNLISFHRTATNANTRFTFIPDAVYHPTDIWSAFFMSDLSWKPKKIPAGRICWEASFDIEDAPVAL